MASMVASPLKDGHGRLIGDLRVSVTDRCNFRCQYCMPAEGLPWLERAELLTFEEIERVVRLLVPLGVSKRPPHRRRAARAPRAAEAGRDAARDRGPRGPLAHHQRLPARELADDAGGRGPRAHQRLARLPLARPLLPDDAPRLPAAGDRRARDARALPAARPDQGQLRRDARLHRGRGASVRGARAPQAVPGSLHRVHAARRRPRVVGGPRADRRGDPRDDRPASTRSSRSPRERARDREGLALPRRPRRDRLRQPGLRAFLRGLRPHPPDRRGQAANLPLQPERDGPPRAASGRRRRRRARGGPSATRSGARSSSTTSPSPASGSRRAR